MGDEKAIKTLVDWWWLYIRVVYESVNENPTKSIKSSYLINILLPEMDKFLANNKKFVSKPKKFANAWTAIEKKANAEMELQWFNSQNKPADPIELVQKMHFNQLNKMSNKKEGIEEVFEKLIRELQNNKNVRLNLLQLLTIEESNIFLEVTKIEYNKNEEENSKKKTKGKRNKNKGKKNKRKKDEQLAESSSSKIMISDENKSDRNLSQNSDVIKSDRNSDENSSDQNLVVNDSDQNSNVLKSDLNSDEIDVIKTDQNIDMIKSDQNSVVNNSDQNSVVYKNDNINALSFDDQNNSSKIASKNAPNDEQKANELISNEFNEQKDKNNELTTNTIQKNDDQNANEIAPTSIIKAEQNVEKITSMTNIFDFTDFCDNSTIFEMYKKYILFYFDGKKMEMLDIGALINEIEQRIKMISDMGKLEHLNDYLNKNGAQNLIATWARIKSDLSSTKLENGQKMRIIEDNLYIIFRNILLFLDENDPLFVTMNTNEKQNLKMQIHLKNILLAFIEAKELGQIPPTLMLEDLGGKLFNLLQIRMGNFSIKKRLEGFKKMMEQIRIDQDLFEKKILKTEQENYLLPTFPLTSQQIFVANSFDVITKSAQYFQHYLTTFLFGDFYKAQEFERKINGGIGALAAIVDKWSNKEARLLASGSLLLYSHTNSSDVNLVCLTPGEKLKINDFMGNDKNSKCIKNKCTEQTNATAASSSLFCQICAHKSTSNLIKIVSESILLIRFNFNGIEFDITPIAVPSMTYLAQEITDNELANLLKQFNWSSNSDQKHMIRSLSSYRSTLYIYHLFYNAMPDTAIYYLNSQNLFNENQRNFRHLLLTVKSWAKNNYIYSNKMGFLNGMSLAIMVTKIILLYPNATLPFLLETFFLFYSARLVKISLQLTKIDIEDHDLHLNSSMFSLLNVKEFEMPIITPKFPAQNVARLVTHSNAKIIRLEMIKALRKIKSMKNRTFDLGALMEFVPFTQKYANFIVINCMAEQMDLVDDFCGFVEWRMRLQIIFSIDTKGGNFETHLYPNVYKENCNLPNNFVETSFRANYCKVWLLGITTSISNNSMSENLSAMAQQFDLTIKRHYYLNKNKGTAPNHWRNIDDFYKSMKMELKSVVTKSEMIRGF